MKAPMTGARLDAQSAMMEDHRDFAKAFAAAMIWKLPKLINIKTEPAVRMHLARVLRLYHFSIARISAMKTTLGLIALLAAAPFALAKEQIVCKQNRGKANVVITLADFQNFGYTFNCVDGTFVVDLSGCAPDGAFGLHSRTGNAALVGVADRWQNITKHNGGVTSNSVSSKEIQFAGGFNSPDVGYSESWAFTLNRATGIAQLKQADGPAATFNCTKGTQKF